MATTYTPTGTHSDASLSKDDQELVSYYKQMYNNATTDAERNAAHQAAENVRSGYGYSGGDDGSEYNQIPEKQSAAQPAAGGGYDLSGYLRQQKAAEIESALAGLKGAYEKSMNGYNAQKEALPETYAAARNAVAAQSDIAGRNFAERANASGLNSGATGQAALSRDMATTGNLAAIDREESNANADIDLATANLAAEYQNAIAAAKSNGNAALANALYEELVRVQGLTRSDKQIADANAQWAQELALKNGLTDVSGLSGIKSADDISALYANALAGEPAPGTGGGDTNNGALTQEQIKTLQAYYGATPDGVWGIQSRTAAGGLSADAAWADYQRQQAANTANQSAADAGVIIATPRESLDYSQDDGIFTWNGKRYSSVSSLLTDMEAAGLSPEEQAAIQRKFGLYGFEISFT